MGPVGLRFDDFFNTLLIDCCFRLLALGKRKRAASLRDSNYKGSSEVPECLMSS